MAALVAASLMVGAGAAQAAPGSCRAADDMALAVRAIQSQLMVAALTCGQRAEYNAFAVRHESALVRNGQALRSYFTRLHGRKAAERELNRFVTALANENSARNIADTPRYCAESRAMFERLLGGGEGLERVSLPALPAAARGDGTC